MHRFLDCDLRDAKAVKNYRLINCGVSPNFLHLVIERVRHLLKRGQKSYRHMPKITNCVLCELHYNCLDRKPILIAYRYIVNYWELTIAIIAITEHLYNSWFYFVDRRNCITYQCGLIIRHVLLSLKRESIQFIESADKSVSYYALHIGISIYNHGVDLHLLKYETSLGIKHFEHEMYWFDIRNISSVTDNNW